MSGYQGWYDSIRTFLQQFEEQEKPMRRLRKPRGPKKEKTEPPPDSPYTKDQLKQIILQAATTTTLLYMTYNGNARYVEPYSYRWKRNPTNNKERELFYGYCWRDQSINSFRFDRIQGLTGTDIKYNPKWTVEIGLQ